MKMKKTYFISFMLMMCLGATIFINSCKKDEEVETGCSVKGKISGGIHQQLMATVKLYVMKDFGCGHMQLTKIRNKSTGEQAYGYGGKIDHIFYGPPSCNRETEGTINIYLPRGYIYEYTVSCTNKTYSGEFSLGCETDCFPVEIIQ